MSNDTNNNVLFSQYYAQWIDVYKKGAIREATMAKYLMTQRWVEKLVPELRVSELTRTAYQQLLNDYAREHERQTTLDFHHQLKGAILDAVDEGMIERDPTRKAIIKGKTPKAKKIKYLNQFVVKFSELTKTLPQNQPVFVGESKVYNSTVNDVLTRHCRRCGISEISIHGLRHTHASLLLFAGVSIASVARRLGHASMTTTQKTYLHIIQELENKDVDLVMRTLSGL